MLRIISITLTVSSFCMFSFSQTRQPATPALIGYVNPLIGTAGSTTISALKHGAGSETFANTIPAVAYPFPMTQWTAQTRRTEVKCIAPYYYTDSLFSGFRASHWLNGGCTEDYGSVTFMPLTGTLKLAVDAYKTSFYHADETSTPAYYRVMLRKYGLTAEMTCTRRCGMMKFTVGSDDSLHLLISPNSDRNEAFIFYDRKNNKLSGYNPAHRIYSGSGKPAGFSGYFVVKFEKPLNSVHLFASDKVITGDSAKNLVNLGAALSFKFKKGDSIVVKVGTSFTSIKEAENNLLAEIPGWNFGQVRSQAEQVWQKALSQIDLQATKAQKVIFYTALYHNKMMPHLFSDVSGYYPRFASNYKINRLSHGDYYDDISTWDIYRAGLPLYEILDTALVSNLCQSGILKGTQGGWLPNLPFWNNYTSEMIGNHMTAFIASAYDKGIRSYDAKEAYRLIKKDAFEIATGAQYRDGRGRRSLANYIRFGYYPLEDSIKDAFHKMEQVSRTIEYAYDDYCAAIMAKYMGANDDFQHLLHRSLNYRKVFDKSRGFSNGRYMDGSFYKAFNPDKKLFFITEGTPRQYTFYAPHDISGLATLMGGTKGLENALDSFFVKGEYWHGNEPDQQAPFMYNYTASSYKTQREVRKILFEEYSSDVGGISGNEDAGQLSAWYILASMGLYQVNPVSNRFEITSPLHDRASVHLAGGKTFTITALKRGTKNTYIKSVNLNGKPYTKNFISYRDIVSGGTLTIEEQDTPNKSFAVRASDRATSAVTGEVTSKSTMSYR